MGANEMSLDMQAARMAESMMPLRKSEGMPTGRAEAEGGFTDDAGGQVIDAAVRGGSVSKAASRAITGDEPGRQGPGALTGEDMTDEPGHEAGGAKPGEGGNLSMDGDGSTRARKTGKVGIPGGDSAPRGMPEDDDEDTRRRKEGKVGIMGKSLPIQGQSSPAGAATLRSGKLSDFGTKKSDDGDEDDEAEKSIDAGDLMKSLDTLEAVAEGGRVDTSQDRRAELAMLLAEGQLTKAGMAELQDLIKAEVEDSEEDEKEDEEEQEEKACKKSDGTISKSFQDQFAEDPTVSEGYDVSPFLERQSQLLAASLDQIHEGLQKSLEAQGGRAQIFNMALAKSLRGMAELSANQNEMIKSLVARVERVENTPLPRRGVTTARSAVLTKSLVGEAGDEQQGPGREQVLNGLERMAMQKSHSANGQLLTEAMALFESTGQITKSLMGEVLGELKKSNGAR